MTRDLGIILSTTGGISTTATSVQYLLLLTTGGWARKCNINITLRKTNIALENRHSQKETSSNDRFSGAMLVAGRVRVTVL